MSYQNVVSSSSIPGRLRGEQHSGSSPAPRPETLRPSAGPHQCRRTRSISIWPSSKTHSSWPCLCPAYVFVPQPHSGFNGTNDGEKQAINSPVNEPGLPLRSEAYARYYSFECAERTSILFRRHCQPGNLTTIFSSPVEASDDVCQAPKESS